MQGTIERANSAAHLNNKKAIVSEGSRQENSTHARNLVQGTRGGRKAERAPGDTARPARDRQQWEAATSPGSGDTKAEGALRSPDVSWHQRRCSHRQRETHLEPERGGETSHLLLPPAVQCPADQVQAEASRQGRVVCMGSTEQSGEGSEGQWPDAQGRAGQWEEG